MPRGRDWDESEHPRHPRGAPDDAQGDGQGGRFRDRLGGILDAAGGLMRGAHSAPWAQRASDQAGQRRGEHPRDQHNARVIEAARRQIRENDQDGFSDPELHAVVQQHELAMINQNPAEADAAADALQARLETNYPEQWAGAFPAAPPARAAGRPANQDVVNQQVLDTARHVQRNIERNTGDPDDNLQILADRLEGYIHGTRRTRLNRVEADRVSQEIRDYLVTLDSADMADAPDPSVRGEHPSRPTTASLLIGPDADRINEEWQRAILETARTLAADPELYRSSEEHNQLRDMRVDLDVAIVQGRESPEQLDQRYRLLAGHMLQHFPQATEMVNDNLDRQRGLASPPLRPQDVGTPGDFPQRLRAGVQELPHDRRSQYDSTIARAAYLIRQDMLAANAAYRDTTFQRHSDAIHEARDLTGQRQAIDRLRAHIEADYPEYARHLPPPVPDDGFRGYPPRATSDTSHIPGSMSNTEYNNLIYASALSLVDNIGELDMIEEDNRPLGEAIHNYEDAALNPGDQTSIDAAADDLRGVLEDYDMEGMPDPPAGRPRYGSIAAPLSSIDSAGVLADRVNTGPPIEVHIGGRWRMVHAAQRGGVAGGRRRTRNIVIFTDSNDGSQIERMADEPTEWRDLPAGAASSSSGGPLHTAAQLANVIQSGSPLEFESPEGSGGFVLITEARYDPASGAYWFTGSGSAVPLVRMPDALVRWRDPDWGQVPGSGGGRWSEVLTGYNAATIRATLQAGIPIMVRDNADGQMRVVVRYEQIDTNTGRVYYASGAYMTIPSSEHNNNLDVQLLNYGPDPRSYAPPGSDGLDLLDNRDLRDLLIEFDLGNQYPGGTVPTADAGFPRARAIADLRAEGAVNTRHTGPSTRTSAARTDYNAEIIRQAEAYRQFFLTESGDGTVPDDFDLAYRDALEARDIYGADSNQYEIQVDELAQAMIDEDMEFHSVRVFGVDTPIPQPPGGGPGSSRPSAPLPTRQAYHNLDTLPAGTSTLREALDALRNQGVQNETAFRQIADRVYNFQDPHTSLRAEVTGIENVGYGSMSIKGKIRNSTGAEVGSFTRTLSADGTVHHSYFRMNQNVQGGGFMTRWFEQVKQGYRDQGFTHVTVSANLDVGGYAWAKQGFDFRDSSHANRLLRDMQSGIAQGRWSVAPETEREIADLLQRIADGQHVTSLEVAMVGWRQRGRDLFQGYPIDVTDENGQVIDVIEMWLGKKFMLGQSWSGVLTL